MALSVPGNDQVDSSASAPVRPLVPNKDLASETDDLLGPHLKAMWNLAFQLVLDPSLADDLTQEACLRALRGYSKFRGGSSLRTWLFRIVINTSRDLFAGRGNARQDKSADDSAEPTARAYERPECTAMQMELEREVSRAMATLPEPLRVALALTTFQGMTPGEVAAVEGCTTATIYWRIHEARKILRKHLEPWTQ
jgi:RNA polymerase sigma-70 factor, ECF subfamily